jgi:sterol desaturase/sphingolipid hydroxylase (fatty acid hydroxylase superfamily)
MLFGIPDILVAKVLGLLSSMFPGMLLMVAACTVLAIFSSQACNPGRFWWQSRGLLVDACYWVTLQCLAPYFRVGLMIGIATLAMAFMTAQDVNDYLSNGRGPLGAYSFWWQVALYLLLSDVLMYWIHRLFHGARLWRFHAIHHSSEDVDWTTAFRFHPVNMCFDAFLVDAMMLFLGVAPAVLLYLVPFQTMASMFVHANLNWTFGPLKYVVATPVFHRWHHTMSNEGGNRNFAPTFAILDVLFGTFYMPAGRLPRIYGVDDANFPRGFVRQLVFPFVSRDPATVDLSRPFKTHSSAIGSARPQPES